MGVIAGFPRHRAQAETAPRVEAGGADPPVIQADRFRLAIFQEQLAIIGAIGRGGDVAPGAYRVEAVVTMKERFGDVQGFGH